MHLMVNYSQNFKNLENTLYCTYTKHVLYVDVLCSITHLLLSCGHFCTLLNKENLYRLTKHFDKYCSLHTVQTVIKQRNRCPYSEDVI